MRKIEGKEVDKNSINGNCENDEACNSNFKGMRSVIMISMSL